MSSHDKSQPFKGEPLPSTLPDALLEFPTEEELAAPARPSVAEEVKRPALVRGASVDTLAAFPSEALLVVEKPVAQTKAEPGRPAPSPKSRYSDFIQVLAALIGQNDLRARLAESCRRRDRS